MSPDDPSDHPNLVHAENIIKALEVLVTDCETQGLPGIAKRITDCIAKCQSDYVTLHRRQYRKGVIKPKVPPQSKH